MSKHTRKLLTLSFITTTTSSAILAINHLINSTAVMNNFLRSNGNQNQIYHWKFGRIHYTVQGSGSPLLLLHDLTPGGSTHEWKYLTDALSKNHTVYCMDLLGCGCSDRPKITYTNFLYVQLITDFIHAVIKEKTDVITSGLSGSFAIMACKNDDTVIDRIMMINPTDLAVLNRIPTNGSKMANFILDMPLIGTLVYNILMSRGKVNRMIRETCFSNPLRPDMELSNCYYESAHLDHGNGKHLLSSIKGNYIYFNITQALKTINNSIYIIEGKSEPRGEESVALYISLNPAIEYELFSHMKHLPHVENPGKTLESIRIFFS